MTDNDYFDEQGILYTIINEDYCVGTNESDSNNNGGSALSVTNVFLPYEINNIKLTLVGAYAFRYNQKIHSIFIPNTIKMLGYDCFAYSSLESILFDDLSSLHCLSRGVFYHCHNIKTIQLPSSVSCLEIFCFSQTALEIITIPGKLTSISSCLFGKSNNPSKNFYQMPKILRLNSKNRRGTFSDYNGAISYIKFDPQQTIQKYFDKRSLLFTLIISLL